MAFIGSINQEVRKWLGNIAPVMKGSYIVVGCSGNFTVEQIVRRNGSPGYLWGNDVSLYSSVLGAYLTDSDFPLDIQVDGFSFLKPFMETTGDKAATVLVLSEALKYEPCKNHFQARLWNHYQTNFAHYHQKTREKLKARKSTFAIDKYTSMDIGELLETIPEESVVIAFMPTYAGGYEKIYKRLDEVFSWDRPRYEIIDDNRKQEILISITGFQYIYIDDQLKEDLPIVAIVQKRGFKTVYLYSNLPLPRKMCIRNKTNYEEGRFDTLSEDHLITPASRITVKRTNNKVVNYYRNLYLKKVIEYVDGNDSFLVFIDGKLFGFLIFSLNRFGEDYIYMLSDFVVPVSRYPRLSKLLLLVSRSVFIKEELKEKYLFAFPNIVTTAFTDKPVSMKYRGIYKLLNRKEGRLNYIAPTGTYNLKEIVPLWLKKYHKKS